MFRVHVRHLKTSLLACAAGASLLASPALAQQVDSNKLLELMVKKGLVSREEADAMIAEATAPAAQPAQPPVPAGGVAADGTQTIPYVPQVVRDQIVQQVRTEIDGTGAE
jgi:membrane peptidoglycan carboxypeptidase